MARSLTNAHSTNMAVLLGLAVVVVIGLAGAAVAVTTYFKRSADGVLRDYTTLAADRFTQAIEITLARTLYPLINTERTALIASGWSPSAAALETTRAASVPAATTVTAIFVRPPDAEPVVWPDSASVPHALSSGTLDDWAAELETQGYFALVFASHVNQLLIYNIERTSAGGIALAYGVVLPLDSVRATVQSAIQQTSALPQHIANGLPDDSVAGVVVTTSDGLTLVDRKLTDTLPHRVSRGIRRPSGITTSVVLAGSLSSRLVHGGPPTGSAWLFVGLASLAVFLLMAATLIWRQDRRLARLREQFVAGVSHELRTPLAQIRLFAETLALGRVRDEAEVQQAYRIVQQETRRLTHLVENLLLFSRQERDRLLLNRKSLDVSALTAAIAEEFEPLARVGGARITTEIEPGLHAEVDADAFRQIALNLLDNAVKYGPDGQTVALRLSGSSDHITLAVEDEGPGIPPEHRERAWERFWRGPGAMSTGEGGSGIGLTVVRELAERHGGSATVQPGADSGACVVVRLPCHAESA